MRTKEFWLPVIAWTATGMAIMLYRADPNWTWYLGYLPYWMGF